MNCPQLRSDRRFNVSRRGVAAITTALAFTLCAWIGFQSVTASGAEGAADLPAVKLLFLGDNANHRPNSRFAILKPVFEKRNITMDYVDNLDGFTPENLAKYDGVLVYSNITRISPEAEKALLDYVAGGKGFIPLHCASACFGNSQDVVALIGGQFARHGMEVFRTELANTDHPIMKGFGGFESRDETYVHRRHNEKDRTVLEYRVDNQGREPYTWTRTHGKGRVFYTAWGHDQQTWNNPGFQNLVERGIRWAVGQDPGVVPSIEGPAVKPRAATAARRAFAPLEMTAKRSDVKPLEYESDVTVPLYQRGSQGQLHEMQKPLSPEESQKRIVTPKGFEAKLFVSEPEIGKPLSMAWDERGRLWIAETVDYPNNPQPEGQGHDRIRIVEDTNGDGKADKFTTFADKLCIPTSICFVGGGVLVQDSGTRGPGPETGRGRGGNTGRTLLLKDTNGDDVADERKVLITGWGTGDTHAVASNLHYGLDNWIYGIVGYSGFQGAVNGENLRFSQALYRFKQDGSKMEMLRNTSNNSWGVGITEEGYLFGSTANGNPSVYMPIPNRYYEAVRGLPSMGALPMIANSNDFYPLTDPVHTRQVDQFGKFTAAAGHEIYTARTYPQDFWNRTAFVTEPTGHLVATFVITPRGANFRDRYDWNLFASDDEWTAPIVAAVGPDGHVWVIDWYNYIVQHNPTPRGFQTGRGNAYDTPLRDKKHGRIYRVVYNDAKTEAPLSLKDADAAKLVATLKNRNMLWRTHAQRLLVERGKLDVVPELIKLIDDQSVDEIGLNPGAIHALGTLNGLMAQANFPADQVNAATIRALRHPSAGVVRNALQSLPATAESADAILAANLLNDPEPQVRLAALLALSTMPARDKAAEALVKLAVDSEYIFDSVLRDGVVCAAAKNDQKFLELLPTVNVADKLSTDGTILVERVADHYARGAPTDRIGNLLVALSKGSPQLAAPVVAGLSRGWPKDKTAQLNDAAENALIALIAKLSTEKGALVKLANAIGSKRLDAMSNELAASLLTQLKDEKVDDEKRLANASELLDLRPHELNVASEVLNLISPRVGPEFATQLLEATGRSQVKEFGAKLSDRVAGFTPGLRATGVRVLLSRTDWIPALLDAIDQNKISINDLSADQRQSLLSNTNGAIRGRVRDIFSRGGALPSADRQKVVDDLMTLTEKPGDAAAGKLVFVKQCAKCHTHTGAGAEGKVGPELSGFAVHPKAELLIAMLDPSRSVEGNFRAYTVTTKDTGQSFTGLLGSESKTAVEIIDAEAKRHSVLRENIEEFVPSQKSLMPDGFEKQVSNDEIVNLLAFLNERGKYLPIPLAKAATVDSTRGMFTDGNLATERIIFDDWSPKTFEGVPFQLIKPAADQTPNAILLYSSQGTLPPKMPKSVELPCNSPAKAIHILGGVSGWGFNMTPRGSVSLIVRLHYADGKTEDHPLLNGEHLAGYLGSQEVPGSKLAFRVGDKQLRYLAIQPKRQEMIRKIELVKGPDDTAPLVMAVTIEPPPQSTASASASASSGSSAKGSE